MSFFQSGKLAFKGAFTAGLVIAEFDTNDQSRKTNTFIIEARDILGIIPVAIYEDI